MCTDFGPDRLRFAGLIPERVQKSEYNIDFQPTVTWGMHGTILIEWVSRISPYYFGLLLE